MDLNYRLILDTRQAAAQLNAIRQQIAGLQNSTNSSGSMGGLRNSAMGFMSVFKGNIAATALSKTLSLMKDVGKQMLDNTVKAEFFNSRLTTLLGGDRNYASVINEKLINLAKTTPFSLEDVQKGSTQLLAYGFQASNLTKDLKMLGNISSGVGAPLNDIVYLYGTLRTQGRAFTKDIYQFTGRGIPIVEQLAKQFNVTTSKIMEMATQGKISFSDIEKAFKSMTAEGGKFFGMMDEQSKTLGGKISNLSDSWDQFLTTLGQRKSGILHWIVEEIQSILDSLTFEQKTFVEIEKIKRITNLPELSGQGKSNYIDYITSADVKYIEDKIAYINEIDTEKLKKGDVYTKFDFEKTVQEAKQKIQEQLDIKSRRIKFEKTNPNYNRDEVDPLEYEQNKLFMLWNQVIDATKKITDATKKITDKKESSTETPEKKGLDFQVGRPTQVNITIQKMNGIENYTTTAKMENNTEDIKILLGKVLLEAVNDANKFIR